jgi:hypothetical protein
MLGTYGLKIGLKNNIVNVTKKVYVMEKELNRKEKIEVIGCTHCGYSILGYIINWNEDIVIYFDWLSQKLKKYKVYISYPSGKARFYPRGRIERLYEIMRTDFTIEIPVKEYKKYEKIMREHNF